MSTEITEPITEPTTTPTGSTVPTGSAPVPEPLTPTTTEPEGSAAEKRYRLQLREAEAERDGLRTVVESMRRQDAERLAGDRLSSSKLLWTLGKGPADVLAEDGSGVDPAKVAELCDAVVAAYGDGVRVSRRPGVAYAPLEGRTVKGRPGAASKGLESAFSPDAWAE